MPLVEAVTVSVINEQNFAGTCGGEEKEKSWKRSFPLLRVLTTEKQIKDRGSVL